MYQFGFDHTPEQFLATFKAFDRDDGGTIDVEEFADFFSAILRSNFQESPAQSPRTSEWICTNLWIDW